jgi:hypothetical protein
VREEGSPQRRQSSAASTEPHPSTFRRQQPELCHAACWPPRSLLVKCLGRRASARVRTGNDTWRTVGEGACRLPPQLPEEPREAAGAEAAGVELGLTTVGMRRRRAGLFRRRCRANLEPWWTWPGSGSGGHGRPNRPYSGAVTQGKTGVASGRARPTRAASGEVRVWWGCGQAGGGRGHQQRASRRSAVAASMGSGDGERESRGGGWRIKNY